MPDPERVRRLLSRSQAPIVFRGLIDWPMLNFTANEWADIFKNIVLDCRVGTRSTVDDKPQWESESVTVQCTYAQLIQWSEKLEFTNSDLTPFNPNKHFLYFGYKYMKDIFDKKILEMVDWSCFGYQGRGGSESTLWLGTPGAHTPCHYDTYGCNLVAQITGRKRWVLYPPEDTPFLQPSRIPYEESSVYSRINFEKWLNNVPVVAHTHPHIIELLPGDVLFVPRHWWHHVRNEEVSISINTWLDLPDLDAEARLHEALVKFLVAHACRNVSFSELFDILNPNEVIYLVDILLKYEMLKCFLKEELADADLDEIQGYVKQSLALKRRQTTKLSEPTTSDEAVENEKWFSYVVCSEVPHCEVGSNPAEVASACSTLDVIRAFTDPRVIKLIADILESDT